MSGNNKTTTKSTKHATFRKPLKCIENLAPPTIIKKEEQGAGPKNFNQTCAATSTKCQHNEKERPSELAPCTSNPQINIERHSLGVQTVELPGSKKLKTTLLKKLSRRIWIHEGWPYKECLYDEYISDNYKYMLYRDKKEVLELSVFRKACNPECRMAVVNWMVCLQDTLGLSDSTFFKAVRMLDALIVNTEVSFQIYTLLGVVCLWISNKLNDVHHISIPTLHFLCKRQYSGKTLLHAEQFTLKGLNFKVDYSDPIVFLYYFLRCYQLENNLIIRYSSLFLLEIFTLLLDFSTFPTMGLVLIALYLSLKKHALDYTLFLNHVQKEICAPKEYFLKKADDLSQSINWILKDGKACDKIVLKYSSERRNKVAEYFIPAENL